MYVVGGLGTISFRNSTNSDRFLMTNGIDQDASLVKTISTLSKWLPTKMMEEETDLIIFFAGHGLASPNGEKLYFVG